MKCAWWKRTHVARHHDAAGCNRVIVADQCALAASGATHFCPEPLSAFRTSFQVVRPEFDDASIGAGDVRHDQLVGHAFEVVRNGTSISSHPFRSQPCIRIGLPIPIDGVTLMSGGVPVRVHPGPLLAGPSMRHSPAGVLHTRDMPSPLRWYTSTSLNDPES